MSNVIDRPTVVEDEHLIYLDELRESGKTNMFGARPYLIFEFDVDKYQAKTILKYWMDSFNDRNGDT